MVSTLIARPTVSSKVDAVPEFYPYEDTGCEVDPANMESDLT